MKLLVSPHCDDEILWCSWTILREMPITILVIYESHIQTARGIPGCDVATRNAETTAALAELTQQATKFHSRPAFRDDTTYSADQISAAIAELILEQTEAITEIWAPAFEEGGHEQHNLVALACNAFEGTYNVHRYLMYTRAGGKSVPESYHPWTDTSFGRPRTKSLLCTICERHGEHWVHHYEAVEVHPPSGEAIARKLRALACFKSQMQLDPRLGTAEWFYGNDLREYILLPAKTGETQG